MYDFMFFLFYHFMRFPKLLQSLMHENNTMSEVFKTKLYLLNFSDLFRLLWDKIEKCHVLQTGHKNLPAFYPLRNVPKPNLFFCDINF